MNPFLQEKKYVKCTHCKLFNSISSSITIPICDRCHQLLKEISEEEYKSKLLSIATIIKKQEKYVKCTHCKLFDSISSSIISPICDRCHQPLKEISEEEYNQKQLLARKYNKKRNKENTIKIDNNNLNSSSNNSIFQNNYSHSLKSPINTNDIIAVNFVSSDRLINYPVWGIKIDRFTTIEEKLLLAFPDLRNKNIYYVANGTIIKRAATLEQNKIKNGNTILINYN